MVIEVHPQNPQSRQVSRIVEVLHRGGLIIYPTDTVYAFGTLAKNHAALERIRKLKYRDKKNLLFTVMSRDISSITEITMPLDKDVFKLIKRNTPGPVTYVLKANKRASKWLKSKRDFVGVRIADHPLIQSLLDSLDDYFVSTSLSSGDEINPFYFEEDELVLQYEKQVDAIVLSDPPPFELSTVVVFEEGEAVVQRQGSYQLI